MAALHGIILHHDYQFQMAALRTSDTNLPNLSTSITPSGWINICHVDSTPPDLDEGGTKVNGYSSSGGQGVSITGGANGSAARAGSGGVGSYSTSCSSGESVPDSLPRKGAGSQSYVPSGGTRSLHPSTSSLSSTPSASYSNIWKVGITLIVCYYLIWSHIIIIRRLLLCLETVGQMWPKWLPQSFPT